MGEVCRPTQSEVNIDFKESVPKYALFLKSIIPSLYQGSIALSKKTLQVG